ncbi:MAG: peptidase M61 [Flavobacterium sp.]|nr:MAG: peptidase M61 [Flavobacterium sp.]
MAKRLSFLLLISLFINFGVSYAQQLESTFISASIDLNNVKNDRVAVTVNAPKFSTDQVTYHFAKIIPGTYAIADYGRLIEEVKAYDLAGNVLPVTRKDVNTILISEAKKVSRLTYWVNDTFDSETGADVFSSKEQVIFSPAGTNILAGKQFWMNLCGFIGYFAGYEEVPYKINVLHPANLYGSTAKDDLNPSLTTDKFEYTRFADVVDNPVMYSRPDTASFKVGEMEVLLSCYSPNVQQMASRLKPSLQKMMVAQKAFLGKLNTTKRYVVLVHLTNMGEGEAKGIGALEHNNSTSAVFKIPMNTQDLISVISHEFFHTITPLKVHSKEIRYFDYENPKMSKHLWFYEGVTEYFANLFQVNQGLISENQFYDLVATKVAASRDYTDSLSFTEMSSHVLQDTMKAQYPNVYQKGALIAMCLDIIIREQSNGAKGLLWLMGELINKYGADKAFDDDTFLDTITALTSKEVGDFLAVHVQGPKPINYGLYLKKMGVQSKVVQMAQPNVLLIDDDVYIETDEDNKKVVVNLPNGNNKFLSSLGIQNGDVLLKINETSFIPEDGYASLLLGMGFTEGEPVTMSIIRKGKKMQITGKAKLNYSDQDGFRFEDQTKASLKNSWLMR